jgi:hypothetical protein
LFTSDKSGDFLNTVYNNHREINNSEELKAAVSFDHVAAAYYNNTRKKEGYIQSNCAMFDVDNTDTDIVTEWIINNVREVCP